MIEPENPMEREVPSNSSPVDGSLFDYFDASEATLLPSLCDAAPALAGVGSVVGKALVSPLLLDALARSNIHPSESRAYADLAELKTAPRWTMALVLSPWKLLSREICDHLTPAAESSGVVDTVLRDSAGAVFGVNTNVFGLAHAVRRLMRATAPGRCLILGAGATSRCAAIALSRVIPDARVGIMGRNEKRVAEIAANFKLEVVTRPRDFDAEMVINCTTVGETSDQRIDLPMDDFLRPETFFLDLNNRPSQFQAEALSRGCVAASGVIMQRAVNMLRAHLIARGGEAQHRTTTHG